MAEFACYPARVLAALLAALLLVTQSSPQVDVALDPGHSRADIGSSGNGLREYQLTLDLAQRVRTRLEAAQLSVRLTREDDLPLTVYTNPLATEQIQAEQAARIVAAGSTRVYVLLHFNGGPTNLRGTETYFNPDRAADTMSSDYALATALQRHVVAALADEVGYASVDRGVKSDLAAGMATSSACAVRYPARSSRTCFCPTPPRPRCCATMRPSTRWPMAALRASWSTWPGPRPPTELFRRAASAIAVATPRASLP